MIFHNLEVSTEAPALVPEFAVFKPAQYRQLELTPTENAALKLQQPHWNKHWKSERGSYENDLC